MQGPQQPGNSWSEAVAAADTVCDLVMQFEAGVSDAVSKFMSASERCGEAETSYDAAKAVAKAEAALAKETRLAEEKAKAAAEKAALAEQQKKETLAHFLIIILNLGSEIIALIVKFNISWSIGLHLLAF